MRFALRSGALAIAVGACAACPAAATAAESWLQPETLSQPGTANDRARIATNAPGVAAVIWSEFAGTRTPRSRIRVSTREPDLKWAPSEQLSGSGETGGGDVGVDPQGRITAIWAEGGKMWYSDHARGGQWTPAQAIPGSDGINPGNPDVFVASDGTATAVWQQGGAGASDVRTARRPLGGAWSVEASAISPTASYRAHIEGDIAGDVTVSYTHDVAGGHQYFAVNRPNSGPWGAQTPLATVTGGDNISDLVVAPNSGQASVFWGELSQPISTRTLVSGTWGAATAISGGASARLDFAELDRAAVDGQGLVTAVWTDVINRTVFTAYRTESTGTWTAPTPSMEIDPGDGSTGLFNPQVASNLFGRAVATWSAGTTENRWSLRGPGPGAPWSAPKAIDGVPADALPLDMAIDDTGRVAYVWSAESGVANVDSLAISTYGNPLNNPQPPAPPGPAPPTSPPPSGGGGGGGSASASAALQGTPTSARGVTLILTMPAAGTATIALDRSALPRTAKSAAAKFRRLGVVKVKLKKGRNVVRIKKVKKRKLPRGSYHATITPKAGGKTLKKIKVTFKIKR
jgi:hypothetical protein